MQFRLASVLIVTAAGSAVQVAGLRTALNELEVLNARIPCCTAPDCAQSVVDYAATHQPLFCYHAILHAPAAIPADFKSGVCASVQQLVDSCKCLRGLTPTTPTMTPPSVSTDIGSISTPSSNSRCAGQSCLVSPSSLDLTGHSCCSKTVCNGVLQSSGVITGHCAMCANIGSACSGAGQCCSGDPCSNAQPISPGSQIRRGTCQGPNWSRPVASSSGGTLPSTSVIVPTSSIASSIAISSTTLATSTSSRATSGTDSASSSVSPSTTPSTNSTTAAAAISTTITSANTTIANSTLAAAATTTTSTTTTSSTAASTPTLGPNLLVDGNFDSYNSAGPWQPQRMHQTYTTGQPQSGGMYTAQSLPNYELVSLNGYGLAYEGDYAIYELCQDQIRVQPGATYNISAYTYFQPGTDGDWSFTFNMWLTYPQAHYVLSQPVNVATSTSYTFMSALVTIATGYGTSGTTDVCWNVMGTQNSPGVFSMAVDTISFNLVSS